MGSDPRRADPGADAPGRGGAGGPSGDHGGTGLSPPGPGVAEVVGRGDRGSLRDRARRDPDRARRAHALSRPRARAADPARAAHRARAISRGGGVSDRGKPLYMIGVVAQMLNVHPQTLRFYEKKGLVRPSRTVGRTRMYSAEDVEELSRLLRLTRDLGVNLAGVEIILKMRRRMLEMQRQIEDLVAYLRESGVEVKDQAARARRSSGPPPASSSRSISSRHSLLERARMTDVRNEKDLPVPDILGILPLRNTVVFPHAVVPLGAGRASSLHLIEEALAGSRLVGAVMQRDAAEDAPGAAGLHRVGTVVVIHRVLKQADGTLRLIVQGLERFRMVEVVQESPYLRARIEPIAADGDATPTLEVEALSRSALSLFQKVVSLSPTLPDELANVAAAADGASALADLIVSSLPTLSTTLKQELLETIDVKQRLERLVGALGKEAEVLELGSKIQSDVQSEMSKTQREYYLREQMKAIQKELGETDERAQEIGALRDRIEAAGMPEEARSEALRELDRLAKMPPAAAEYTVARTYIDWLVAMPWQQETTDNVDIEGARRILDEDHEGLEKVKERILEHLAVKKIRPSGKDPILCFVGPPGVGKTSLGRSIARALGRKFHRISLGGMRDEAEIRGHRRTYIGALPGQIIQGLRRAGTKNPVFMLDEIDKLGMDFRGDPASALLEVLDPEQNATFRDHYLDVPFDLSRVLFITTANVVDTVPAPLRDRMEVIKLAGYTEEEKIRIAQTHLVPKQARSGSSPLRCSPPA